MLIACIQYEYIFTIIKALHKNEQTLLADESEAKQRMGARLLLEADAVPTRNVEDRVCERALSQLLPAYRHLAD